MKPAGINSGGFFIFHRFQIPRQAAKMNCPFANTKISYTRIFHYLGWSVPGLNEVLGNPKYTVSGKTIADVNDVQCRAAVEEFKRLLAEIFERSRSRDGEPARLPLSA